MAVGWLANFRRNFGWESLCLSRANYSLIFVRILTIVAWKQPERAAHIVCLLEISEIRATLFAYALCFRCCFAIFAFRMWYRSENNREQMVIRFCYYLPSFCLQTLGSVSNANSVLGPSGLNGRQSRSLIWDRIHPAHGVTWVFTRRTHYRWFNLVVCRFSSWTVSHRSACGITECEDFHLVWLNYAQLKCEMRTIFCVNRKTIVQISSW